MVWFFPTRDAQQGLMGQTHFNTFNKACYGGGLVSRRSEWTIDAEFILHSHRVRSVAMQLKAQGSNSLIEQKPDFFSADG